MNDNGFKRIFLNKQNCLKFWYEHYKNGTEKNGFEEIHNWIHKNRIYQMVLPIGDDRYWLNKSEECKLFLETLRDSSILKNNKFQNKLNFANLNFNNFETIEWNDSNDIPTFKIKAINDENKEIKIGIIVKKITNMNVDFYNINKVSDEIDNLMTENCKLHSKEYNSLYLILMNGIDPNSLPDNQYGNYAINLFDRIIYQKQFLPFTSVFEIPEWWVIE